MRLQEGNDQRAYRLKCDRSRASKTEESPGRRRSEADPGFVIGRGMQAKILQPRPNC